jgi:hypothetical protein
MRSTDIIRGVLDLIDNVEGSANDSPGIVSVVDPLTQISCDDEERRLQQVIDFLSQSYQMYDNSPAEVVAGIDSVTRDAGGGWMAPKNPADIRADSVSMYPYHSHKPGV